ncbi:MAG: hypothetical protein KGH61_01305 [Candidatus Micrarchaeota archaeon]|nr:hypothetical protein [Candidatus Micrarchaeota archaeon]MDE1847569.1 hypothetical protein [Candidatus Micrarchaeota archaeon]MDE1864286.1 hypothetical protein [Candidatus Micrarchaeota archaeon]
MNNLRYASLLIASLVLINCVGAYSITQVYSSLSSYNVSTALSSSLTAVNATYLGSNYVTLYQGTTPFFVINVSSSPYLIVLNATQIYNIIRPHVLNASIKLANYPQLSSMLKRYQSSSSTSISDCLVETGLASGATCTAANYCQSCGLNPDCSKALYATGGPTGTIGIGIMQFESGYGILNSSFNNFFALSKIVNSSSIGKDQALLNSSFANISSISRSLYQNPIFPPLANITNSQFAACSNYIKGSQPSFTSNVPSLSGPWYCNAVGFCQFVTYNYSLLNQVQVMLNNINALPITNQQIMGVAANTSVLEDTYVLPVLTKSKNSQFATLMNTTLAQYRPSVNKTAMLLTHLSNATLSSQLLGVQGAYANLTQNLLSVNLTKATASLALKLSAMQSTYSRLEASYLNVTALASNNTALLIMAQLDSKSQAPNIASLAYSQLAYNIQVNGKLSNATAVAAQLTAYSRQIKGAFYGSEPLFSLTEFTRALDAPLVGVLAPLIGPSYQSAIALVPFIAPLTSALVGIVILLLVYAYYASLMGKHKLRISPRSISAWRKVFLIIAALVIIGIAINYAYASAANASAPSGAFNSAISSASSVAIIINGTQTPNETSCATALSSQLGAMHKKVIRATISNSLCTVQNRTISAGSCMSQYAQQGIPVVLMTSASTSSIGIYSFYGSVMSVSGNDAFMAACYPAILIK